MKKIIRTYENYLLDLDNIILGLDLGRFSKKIDKLLLTLNYDGTYDYNGNLSFMGMGLGSLKEIPIRFRNVNGNFNCSLNTLMSLEGSPYYVRGDFNCGYNNIISLQYLPSKIDGDFVCNYNCILSKRILSIIKGRISLKKNPFEITDEVIETVKALSHEQQMNELDFFELYDTNAYEMMKEILDGLGIGYGEETRSMVGVMNKDFTNAKEMF